jgi:hypothetical protein
MLAREGKEDEGEKKTVHKNVEAGLGSVVVVVWQKQKQKRQKQVPPEPPGVNRL